MAVTWTPAQQKVIELKNRSLLVSAAAGSGKTAVLVERIIQKMMRKEHPIDVDRLLIVTFTNAAAAQMRDRIRQAIEARLEVEPENAHLRRQQTLLNHAKITTIDSFCLSVLREQFHQIDLDPAFRTADQGELQLLKEDVLTALIEEEHTKKDPAFLAFWDAYNPGREDTKAGKMILSLHGFAMSNPRPLAWLSDCRAAYQVTSAEELETSPWMGQFCAHVHAHLNELAQIMADTLHDMQEEGDMEAYEDVLSEELLAIQTAEQAAGYTAIRSALLQISFGKKPRKKKSDTYDEALAELLWEQRNEVKKEIETLCKQYFWEPIEEVFARHQAAGVHINVLLSLTEQFMEAFKQAKAKRGLIDFQDMEHMVLELFSKETEHGEEPTEIAKEYADRFEEIIIDEYQDSNYVQELILTSISKEHMGRPNCFMVGDVKQSIYRFRLARSELFMEKYRTYTTEDSPHQKIELHQNFRSRASVLKGINYFFYQLMDESLGHISYDDEAALYPGTEYEPTEENAGGPIRLLLLDTEQAMQAEDSEEGSENEDSLAYQVREWEAAMLAEEIKKLTDEQTGKVVWDSDTKEYRKAMYKDITILLRTMDGWAEDFVNVLGANGIAAVAESGSGYFSAIEVQTVVNLLKVVSNPIQDIPLAAVMHSPIGGFSNEELAIIRCAANEAEVTEDGLWGAVCYYRGMQTKNAAISEKLTRFLERIEDYRERSGYLSLHRLLSYMLDDCGYYGYVNAMPGSVRRKANLDMLLEKAERFEATSYHGVFQFVRYLEKLKKYEIDYPEAAEGASVNAVRIMSIHKSKGLEFPIVIVAGMGKQFNEQDIRQEVILHPDFGVGADAIDIESRTKAPALMKKILANEKQLDNLGEELRILYVAMTRAKEILILSGAKKNLNDWLQKKLAKRDGKDDLVSYRTRSSAKTYLDWVVAALGKNECFDKICREHEIAGRPYNKRWHRCDAQFSVSIVTVGALQTKLQAKRMDAMWYQKELKDLKEAFDQNKAAKEREAVEELREHLAFSYKYDDSYTIPSSVSVSELKKQLQLEQVEEGMTMPFEQTNTELGTKPDTDSNKDPNKDPNKESITERGRITGAERGTLYHYMFDHLDPCSDRSLSEQFDALYKKGILTKEEYQAVTVRVIEAFYKTELGKRCIKARKANTFHKEESFCLGVPVHELYPDARCRDDQWIKVHGIIDAWFEEDGKIVLYDYKTDFVTGENWQEELLKRYQVQLAYYKRALEQITGKRVEEVYIYSVRKREAVLCCI